MGGHYTRLHRGAVARDEREGRVGHRARAPCGAAQPADVSLAEAQEPDWLGHL